MRYHQYIPKRSGQFSSNMALSSKLHVVREMIGTQSADTAVTNIMTKKKLTDEERKGVRTLFDDLKFKIRHVAKDESFDDDLRGKIWDALDYMTTIPNMKFLKGQVEASMAGFRPGVLDLSEDDAAVDELIHDIDSNGDDGENEDGEGEDPDEEDEEDGEVEQSSSFRDIQGGSQQAGEYKDCIDRAGEVPLPKPNVPKRKAAKQDEPANKKSRPANKKSRDSSPEPPAAPGKSKLWTARASRHTLCLELSETKSLYFGKHPELVEEVTRRNAAMAAGKTPLTITENTLALISRYVNNGVPGAILTLLTRDELGKFNLDDNE